MAERSNRSVLLVLAVGHGVTDLYANFLSGLLPFFKNSLNLSKSRAGALIFAMTFSGSLCQVLYAYLGDKWNRKFFVVIGPAVCAIFICFIALSPNFHVLLILLLMGGMGVSAFHPHAASFVGATSGSKRGFGLSVFMTIGTAGFAFGPLISTALVSSPYIGAGRMPPFSIVGIIASLFLYKYADLAEEHHEKRESVDILGIIKPHAKPLAFLSMIVVLRAAVSIIFANFMSFLMVEQRGLSLTVGGRAISLFLISTAAGTLLGGYLYDKISRRKLLMFSLILSSPILFTMVHAHGAAFVILLILGGMTIGCSNPIPLAMAQELVPKGASTASSIMMGLSWGLAGLLAWFFGRLSDSFGGDVVPAMSIAAFLPILAILFVLLLPQTQETKKSLPA